MLRTLTAIVLLFACTACAYASDVDLAPVHERASRQLLVTGDYCAVEASPAHTVRSSEDCFGLSWDPTLRSYRLTEQDDADGPGEFALVDLKRDLYLVQAEDRPDRTDGRYKFVLAIVRNGAFLLLPTITEDKVAAIAAEHPMVMLRADTSDPVISGGGRNDIKAFLRALAVEAARTMDLPTPLEIGVPDVAGEDDHSASPAQVRAVEDVVAALQRLRGRS